MEKPDCLLRAGINRHPPLEKIVPYLQKFDPEMLDESVLGSQRKLVQSRFAFPGGHAGFLSLARRVAGVGKAGANTRFAPTGTRSCRGEPRVRPAFSAIKHRSHAPAWERTLRTPPSPSRGGREAVPQRWSALPL